MPVERLTRERRRQQTRDVLIAAAAEVFARRGFEGASLEEIAETAGFTRGAIYKNFGGKEDLFFAVTDGMNERIIESFRSIAPTSPDPDDWDLARIADTWRAVTLSEDLLAIGMEYELYVLRNPAARERALEHRQRNVEVVADFIEEVADASGMRLRLPATALARVILATADGLNYASRIDGTELFGPFLDVLMGGMFAGPEEPARPRQKR